MRWHDIQTTVKKAMTSTSDRKQKNKNQWTTIVPTELIDTWKLILPDTEHDEEPT